MFTFADRAFSGGALAAVLGAGYTGSRNLDVSEIHHKRYEFGAAVSLNGAGDRLAVGAPEDDGRANGVASGGGYVHSSGAVYLFTFTDLAFSGGTLAAIMGRGRAGGKNVDVALDGDDRFGTAVSLNAAGNRLAVGAPGDNARANSYSAAGRYDPNTGAVYLFTFTDRAFSNGTLVVNAGKGYNDRNVHVTMPTRRTSVRFGYSVSLNGAGTRLAVGAPDNVNPDNAGTIMGTGAVYLFTFTDRSFSGGRLAAIVGAGYKGGRNIDVGGLRYDPDFGASVSLNGAGDRLAVGVPWASSGGAVYLFTFTDRSFSGGRLEAIVGTGYTGTKDVHVTDDRRNNYYELGRAVSLNATGDRLAAGVSSSTGAVLLFTFTDRSFSGGKLAAVVGSGDDLVILSKEYSGGKDITVDLPGNWVRSEGRRRYREPADRFGISVSLNGAGDRLAVGAPGDDGPGENSGDDYGAVYLFTFADRSFSGGRLAATVGKGYTGGRNVNVAELELHDKKSITSDSPEQFGISVSLNAVGDRLAVGAIGDDSAGNTAFEAGAVYLFAFTDHSFSGGQQVAIMGRGYTRGRNVDVAAIHRGNNYRDSGDRFGHSVSLNGAGDRLAVGSPHRNSAGRISGNPSVYLFTFTDTEFSGGALAATVGWGYSSGRTSGKNIPVVDVDPRDGFGTSLSMNSAGDLLAVGAPGDDDVGNSTYNAGAVYLFTFTDTVFSGGTLAAIVGKGYAGGRNVDVAELEREDGFGAAVSLNGAGTRLAVGAPGDDGGGNTAFDAGAVYLFSFTDTAFSGGRLATVVGRDYADGQDFDIASLDNDDNFGASVALNGAGDRLAVGASGDDGPSASGYGAGAVHDTGAVYLFTFADSFFSDAQLAATVGKGYVGGRNVGLRALEEGDRFGTAVSLNAAGTRLAVGTPGDDGAGNTALDAGAVYLLTFVGRSFLGGKLDAVVGKGNPGGRNVDVTDLEEGDRFGAAVSLNGGGNRLAVGAPGDDGASNKIEDVGAVYLFAGTNASFSSARLAATVGKSYVGGKNINLRALEENDGFGGAVSLNGTGNRLAVGAAFDDGIHHNAGDAGAVYLFVFADTAFSDGRLVAIAGKNYMGSDGTH